MKKFIAVILVLLLVSSLAACGDNSSNSSNDSGSTAQAVTQFAETVIVDNDEIGITFTEFDPNGDWGATFTCLLENKTDKTLMFSLDGVSVNGIMCDPYWAEEVAPGKNAYSEISWSDSMLEGYGINYIENVEGTLTVYDSNDWSADDIYDDVIQLEVTNTGMENAATEDVVFDNGFNEAVLVSTDDVSVVVKDYDPDGDWGATFTVYIENKTDQDLTFSIDEVSVNGTMCDPYWAEEVLAGKNAYSEISWYDSTLEESHIESIENVECLLTIYDSNDWSADNLFEDYVTISVE
jgi:hypothetical protein